MKTSSLPAVSTFLVVGLWMPSLAVSDQSIEKGTLQSLVESIHVGMSDAATIEKLFGKPESSRKGVEWHDRSADTKRTMYNMEYPSKGVSFSLFTNPSELYDITITTKDISIRGLCIGDTLGAVRKELGEQGEWRTTDAHDWWWLDFEAHGLRFGFERDKKQKKYPMKLANPRRVSRIEVYNSKVSFLDNNEVLFAPRPSQSLFHGVKPGNSALPGSRRPVRPAPGSPRQMLPSAQSDFVLEARTGLPHRFPEHLSAGVWVSSVPGDMDVFVFPKAFKEKFQVFEAWVHGKSAAPFYLGKTPLWVKLKHGEYRVLLVHPEIKDKGYKPRHVTDTLRIPDYDAKSSQLREKAVRVQYEVDPFLDSRGGVQYAVEGKLFWTRERLVDFKGKSMTIIALFQREDQPVSAMLDTLPREKTFAFKQMEELAKVARYRPPGKNLTDTEKQEAQEMLDRGGIWAKKFSTSYSLVAEMQPNGQATFAWIHPKTMPMPKPPKLRTWNDNGGSFSVEAELVSVNGNVVRLRKGDGRVIEVPFNRLSAADQQFIQQQK